MENKAITKTGKETIQWHSHSYKLIGCVNAVHSLLGLNFYDSKPFFLNRKKTRDRHFPQPTAHLGVPRVLYSFATGGRVPKMLGTLEPRLTCTTWCR